MDIRAKHRLRFLYPLLVVTVFIFISTGNVQSNVYAQENPINAAGSQPAATETPYVELINPYFSIEHRTLADGTQIEGYIINGPPTPPSGYAHEPTNTTPSIDAVILPSFPSYDWVFGCSAVSGAMIAAYYDRGAYPNMYAGPTDGGVMPLTDTSWPQWSDVAEVFYPNNPLIASHNGVDGRSTNGSIDDYWVQYNSIANDPYIGHWTQHTWGTAIGDYMKTSQSAYDNTDGSTTFYNWQSNEKLTCSDMEFYNIDHLDGTYGRKLFYEARGYTVGDCYSQNTDNNYSGGFSLANFQAEVNAGNPVLLNLAGHSIVGYGYEGSSIYIRDTWDNDPSTTYTMTWGASYAGMELLSVSVVHLNGDSGPEMDVRGNSVSITDGDATPSLSDWTDFGATAVTGGTVSHTFTIHNLGDTNLNLTGVPKVNLSGAHAADFNVTVQPSSPVAAGGSTSFTVVFNPSDAGVRTAAISIANNDDNENPYNFAIQGTGTTGPEMDVRGNGVSITDGDATPSLSDWTDFGATAVTGGTVSRTFTIHNLGDTNLNLTGVPKVNISGAHAADFNVTVQPSSPVAASGSTSFTVVFNPSDSGVRTAAISIANNDDNENPYNFAIQGSGTSDPISQGLYLPLVMRPRSLPGTLNAIGDSNILQGYPGSNYGAAEEMLVGYDDYYDPDLQIGRGLIKFDLSAIPPGTSISSANLQVFYIGYYDYVNYSRVITSYRISSDWTEMGVTWNNQPSFAESYGSVSIIANSSWRYVNLDVTTLVQAWVSGIYPNYGIMLRGPEASGSDSSWREFATRHTGYVPRLVLTYSGSAANTESTINLETLPENNSPLSNESGANICREYLTPVKCFAHR